MSEDTPAEPAVPPNRHRIAKIAAALIVVPLLVFLIYSGIVLNWAYSTGARAGIVQKISHKGWLCKTWEGELAMTTVPGVAPTIWYFTVRDNAVAQQVSNSLGKRVVLHYAEHRGVPTRCFGDTPYFVDSVRVEGVP